MESELFLPSAIVAPSTALASETRSDVSTKLFQPSLRANFVARPHLISLLNSAPSRRLTLICAPAGYGKSTLTAQWLVRLPLPSAWVTLDTTDNNPGSFFRLIVAALRTIHPGFGVATEAFLSSNGLLPPDAIVHRLIADLSMITQEFILVLDDFETIELPEIQQAVNLLLEHAPATMQVVLISRTDPPLRLARFRANGELLEIREQNLAFSHAEALRFCQERLELDLTSSEVGILHQRTEGWVAGLQLVGVALRGLPNEQRQCAVESHEGISRSADKYLWAEIFQRQPDEIRAFLLRTSLLDLFSAELCDAVTGQQNSEELIRRCERDNLFVIPLDGIGAWYRYQRLFAGVMRDRLAQELSEEELAELHRKASQWFETVGLVADAVRHAIAGRLWDRAVDLLEAHCVAFFELDHVATLRDWLQGLPDPIFDRSPRLAFWFAWALGRMGLWSEAARPLRVAEEAWIKADDPAGRGSLLLLKACFGFDRLQSIAYTEQSLALLPQDRSAERIFALSIRAIGHLHRGEPEQAEHVFAEQRSLVASTGLSWFRLHEMAHSAGVLIQRGKLQEASILCRRVIQAAGDTPVQLWVQAALCRLGSIHFEWNQLDDASEILQRANELAELTGSIQWRGRIRVGLSRIAWASGKRDEALNHLKYGLGFARQIGNEQEERTLMAWRARFWLDSRQFDLVSRWAGNNGWESSRSPNYERQVEDLTYVRFLISDGRHDLALSILEAIGQQADAAGRQGDVIEISMLAALAHIAAGDNSEAQRTFNRSLALGHPSDYVRVFVDEGKQLAPLLRQEALRSEHRAYAQRLLAVIEGTGFQESTDPLSLIEALSEREIEVLRLAGTGMPNRQIGERLFISEATVKSHMNHLLRKLDTTNRIHAMERARTLGLL